MNHPISNPTELLQKYLAAVPEHAVAHVYQIVNELRAKNHSDLILCRSIGIHDGMDFVRRFLIRLWSICLF